MTTLAQERADRQRTNAAWSVRHLQAVETVQARQRAVFAARLDARRIVAQVLWDATGHPTDVTMRAHASLELAERMNDGRVPITALPSTLWQAVTS